VSKWQTAYLGEKGVEIYQMAGQGQSELLYSGSLEGLKPVSGGGQRRILILGRSKVIRIRKQYPPMKMDKLLRAVEMEAPDLFPMVNCSFHCKIAKTYPTHVILDVWAWEREPLELLKKSFAFGYVIPEDLVFLSSPSGIYIYPYGSMIHVIACGEGRFMDAASYPAAGFSKVDLELFLTGLADSASSIKEIRFYGNTAVDVPSELISRVKKFPKTDSPPFLQSLEGSSIKPFRQKNGRWLLNINKELLLRLAIYTTLAYGLMLYLTLHNYDKALMSLKNKIMAADKEINLLNQGGSLQGDKETINNFEARMKETVLPLKILDVLAATLPEESYIKSLALNSGMLEVTVSARDPLMVLKKLSLSERIGKVSLKGSPTKEPSTGIYSFALSVEIRP
jgi:hypothetical protein